MNRNRSYQNPWRLAYWPMVIAFGLALMLPMCASGQPRPQPDQYKTFRLVDGSHWGRGGSGTLATVRPRNPETGGFDADSTLTIYFQHRSKHDPINYKKARRADRVFWCYPDSVRNPDLYDHVLPGAEGKVYALYDKTRRYLMLYDDG